MTFGEPENTTGGFGGAMQGVCAACNKSLGVGSRIVRGKSICANCYIQATEEIAAQQVNPYILPLAFIAALLGALVGAAVWVLVSVYAHFEIGYVAVLVGFLAGSALLLVARNTRGVTLQVEAALAALIGLIVGKYFSAAFVVQKMAHAEGIEIDVLSQSMFSYLWEIKGQMFDLFDILWLAIALSVAWKLPRRVNL
jgi:hypothetical protein